MVTKEISDLPISEFRIQPACLADQEAVKEIERLSFPVPWAAGAFADELARPWARVEVLREEPSGPVVAFANYWLVADEVHLLNVAVHPRHRRKGHAGRLLAHIMDVGRAAHYRLITLEVRRSNEAAQRIYQRLAFTSIGIRPQYYADNNEDALVMLLQLRGDDP